MSIHRNWDSIRRKTTFGHAAHQFKVAGHEGRVALSEITPRKRANAELSMVEKFRAQLARRWKHLGTVFRPHLVPELFLVVVWSLGVAGICHYLEPTVLHEYPWKSSLLFGSLLFFTITFYNQNSEDRWWEARCKWGAMTSSCATLVQTAALIIPDTELAGEVCRRVIAYMFFLKWSLRNGTADVEELEGILSECQVEELASMTVANARIKLLLDIRACIAAGLAQAPLGNVSLAYCAAMEAEVNDIQSCTGACLRIKNTPIPEGHEGFMVIFTWVFLFYLPIGLVVDWKWNCWIPVFLAGWLMLGMIDVAREMQDPFGLTSSYHSSDLDLDGFCRAISTQCTNSFSLCVRSSDGRTSNTNSDARTSDLHTSDLRDVRLSNASNMTKATFSTFSFPVKHKETSRSNLSFAFPRKGTNDTSNLSFAVPRRQTSSLSLAIARAEDCVQSSRTFEETCEQDHEFRMIDSPNQEQDTEFDAVVLSVVPEDRPSRCICPSRCSI